MNRAALPHADGLDDEAPVLQGSEGIDRRPEGLRRNRPALRTQAQGGCEQASHGGTSGDRECVNRERERRARTLNAFSVPPDAPNTATVRPRGCQPSGKEPTASTAASRPSRRSRVWVDRSMRREDDPEISRSVTPKDRDDGSHASRAVPHPFVHVLLPTHASLPAGARQPFRRGRPAGVSGPAALSSSAASAPSPRPAPKRRRGLRTGCGAREDRAPGRRTRPSPRRGA